MQENDKLTKEHLIHQELNNIQKLEEDLDYWQEKV
jgi:hypothetical protein